MPKNYLLILEICLITYGWGVYGKQLTVEIGSTITLVGKFQFLIKKSHSFGTNCEPENNQTNIWYSDKQFNQMYANLVNFEVYLKVPVS